MDFVEDVDLVARLNRGVADALDDVADAVDAGVRRGVHLHHVHVLAGHDGGVVPAVGGQLQRGAVDDVGLVVEGAGQQAGGGGLADAADAGEHEGVGDAAGGEGVGQGADHGLLADQVLEGARPVFAGEDGVGLAIVGVGGGAVVGGRRGFRGLRSGGGLGGGGFRRRGGLGLAHAGGLGRAEHVVGVGIALLDFGRVLLPRRAFETRIDVAHGSVLAREAERAHPLSRRVPAFAGMTNRFRGDDGVDQSVRSGIRPPLSRIFCITCLCSQMFMVAVSEVSPV